MIFAGLFIALFAFCRICNAVADSRPEKKNIILIIADDLDLVLDGMTPLKRTAKLIGKNGANYTNYYVASPLCCPNRASILTGQYPHNHKTFNNTIEGGCSSLQWQKNQEQNTFASFLKTNASYTTFYAGKYMNEYGYERAGGVTHVPVGWDWWYGLVGNSRYYNYSLSINGTEEKYGQRPNDYLTDVIADRAINFLQVQSSKNPFLMVLAPPAPHAPFMPATRHNDEFKGIKAKRTPNFNIPDNKEKHWLVRMGPAPLSESVLTILDEVYRRRWETLLAVDEMVDKIYKQLELSNLLEDTYIIFTSDNGYHIGQFSMTIDKRQPYETDIHVPLLIRGPGIEPSNITAGVSSVDIFATILEIAGLKGIKSDGRSFLNRETKLLKDRALLIEYHGEKSTVPQHSGCPSDSDSNLSLCVKELACKCEDALNNTYNCLRRVSYDRNTMYCEFNEFGDNDGNNANQKMIEFYDLNNDVYELHNIAKNKSILRKTYRNQKIRIKKLLTCTGENCFGQGDTKADAPLPHLPRY